MEWETSDVIALVAAIGTILAVAVTGVSIWLNYRGAEKRHLRQIDHERREAVVTIAARSYAKAYKLVMAEADAWSEAAVADLSSDLAYVMAVGWTRNLKLNAEHLDVEIDALRIHIDDYDVFQEHREVVSRVLEEYRKAIAE